MSPQWSNALKRASPATMPTFITQSNPTISWRLRSPNIMTNRKAESAPKTAPMPPITEVFDGAEQHVACRHLRLVMRNRWFVCTLLRVLIDECTVVRKRTLKLDFWTLTVFVGRSSIGEQKWRPCNCGWWGRWSHDISKSKKEAIEHQNRRHHNIYPKRGELYYKNTNGFPGCII